MQYGNVTDKKNYVKQPNVQNSILQSEQYSVKYSVKLSV